jgi:hypothetical protein
MKRRWYAFCVKLPRPLIPLLVALPAFLTTFLLPAQNKPASKPSANSQSAAKPSGKGQAPAQQQAKSATKFPSNSSSKQAQSKSAASKQGVAKAGSSKSKKGQAAAARRPAVQRTPEPERIREIQQALASRGYNVEPNGQWDQRSMEALKKFQEDQNITNFSGRGKLDSLTLIALGLGPKRENAPAAPAQGAIPEGKNP